MHDRRTRARYQQYAFDPIGYIVDILDWEPTADQAEIVEAYRTAMLKQHERAWLDNGYRPLGAIRPDADRIDEEDNPPPGAYAVTVRPGNAPILTVPGETGLVAPFSEVDLTAYVPGETIKNEIRAESGHGIGKTKVVAALANHAFDCFAPLIGYIFSTDFPALRDKTFKELFGDREGKGLPGRAYRSTLRLESSGDQWIQGRATSDTHGQGKTRVHGLHHPYLFFAIDEAEGVEQYVFDAIRANMVGGIGVALYIGNPMTRMSPFYRIRTKSNVLNLRFSSLGQPNVVTGREVVPGGMVTREWAEEMIADHCIVTGTLPDAVPDPAYHDFHVPWYTIDAGGVPSVPVLRPDDDFLYQVMGIPPTGTTIDTVIPYGVYESAVREGEGNAPVETDKTAKTDAADREAETLYIGVDVARFGTDKGAIFARFRGRVWKAAICDKMDTDAYGELVLSVARHVAEATAKERHGLTFVSVRVDGTGGFGSGLIDWLRRSDELDTWHWTIHEVQFGARPSARDKYANLITELYYATGEALKGLQIVRSRLGIPAELEADLCDRKFVYKQKKQYQVKALEDKEAFRKRFQRSPDDGDGFVLAASHEYLYSGVVSYNKGAEGQVSGSFIPRY